MTTPPPLPSAVLQQAQLVQLANRQRLLQRQAEELAIARAVKQALKG